MTTDRGLPSLPRPRYGIAWPASYTLAPGSRLLSGPTMGTRWSVRLSLPRQDGRRVRALIEACLGEVDAQMSTWRPDSDISRFNAAPAGSWQRLPDAFWRVLDAALAVARDTDGAFDPTVGTLVDLWGFGPQGRPGAIPGDAQIASAQAVTGWRRLQRDTGGQMLRQPGLTRLDLSGIAKGHAVDLVSQRLSAAGFASHLVEIGGELRATGRRPDGRPWHVAVRGGSGARGGAGPTLELPDLSIATSGDDWRVFEQAGRRYSHTIDPRTGRPIPSRLASVTVVHRNCMTADALATALAVMGPQAGLTFARTQGIPALFRLRNEAEGAGGNVGAIAALPSPAFAGLTLQMPG